MMLQRLYGFTLALLLSIAITPVLCAQPPIQPTVDITKVPPAAQPSAGFDAEAATEAYMRMIPPEATARSNAYFEGGYWLLLWDFLYGAAISLLLLNLRWSARMRDAAARLSRFRWIQTLAYWVQYLVVTTILGFPLAWYEGLYREQKYGLATQSFGPWLGDQIKGLLVLMALGGIATLLLFAIVRKFARTWWIWGSLAGLALAILAVAIGPVYIQPIFNKINRLDDPKVTTPILRMAHANGIPAHDVYEIDASRQTTRMSANVSGFAGTMRITLNDNLLRRGSLEEIEAVMGHEMGHYVLNHILKDIFFIAVVITLSMAYLFWGLQWCIRRWGGLWGIQDVGDSAVLPLAALLFSTLIFVLTPVLNNQTRMQEKEADMFGLNVSRQPDGFAQAAIHLGEYRKMRPGRLEEWLFFDHPSGYDRIHSAMVWKSQNLDLFSAPAVNAAAGSPRDSPRIDTSR
ncbi:MAG TPA: M48 family metallopeptidase [Terracidiphilus sp.]|jgi:STE24 endopeptidase|nr:M48 family metallopeptidase [Terracidiphilus sp.]